MMICRRVYPRSCLRCAHGRPIHLFCPHLLRFFAAGQMSNPVSSEQANRWIIVSKKANIISEFVQ
jgi:hypothetical protein